MNQIYYNGLNVTATTEEVLDNFVLKTFGYNQTEKRQPDDLEATPHYRVSGKWARMQMEMLIAEGRVLRVIPKHIVKRMAEKEQEEAMSRRYEPGYRGNRLVEISIVPGRGLQMEELSEEVVNRVKSKLFPKGGVKLQDHETPPLPSHLGEDGAELYQRKRDTSVLESLKKLSQSDAPFGKANDYNDVVKELDRIYRIALAVSSYQYSSKTAGSMKRAADRYKVTVAEMQDYLKEMEKNGGKVPEAYESKPQEESKAMIAANDYAHEIKRLYGEKAMLSPIASFHARGILDHICAHYGVEPEDVIKAGVSAGLLE